MLHNLKHILGHKLLASDGPIGRVKDFYFDDQTWGIRYLVADTGTWLPGRQVLLSPYSFGRLDLDGQNLSVDLTRKQIENSPSIDTDRPVSRQYEKSYYCYYGWPAYWEGGSLWGSVDYPASLVADRLNDFKPDEDSGWDDVHLRSTNAVTGYGVEGTDGAFGSISGFLVDPRRWAICELTVETGHWYSGKEILITPSQIERISYEESKVLVKLTKKNLESTEGKHLAIAGA
jgi:hypothetical protein